MCSPVKKVFFFPSRGKKNPIFSEAAGLGWLVTCLGWLQSPGKCCSSGISRIHHSSLRALRCLCVTTVTAENLHYCAFWCCADPWFSCKRHLNSALDAPSLKQGNACAVSGMKTENCWPKRDFSGVSQGRYPTGLPGASPKP